MGPIWGGGGVPEVTHLLIVICFASSFVAARFLLDFFVFQLMPILETLYNASRRTPNQIYMLLIILLILSQDSYFNAGIHKLMSVAEVRPCSTSDSMNTEQKVGKPEIEGHDSLDNIFSQEIGRDPFLSFFRTGESFVQWIQLLHALDQQGSNKISNCTKHDNRIEGKERELDLTSFPSEMNIVKDYVHSLKSSGLPSKGTKNTSQQIQTLNIPEAVVAFVQAAAKASGEPEKYLPGWPFLSPSKVQLQKCDKCSREFCSPINYRRHIRVHRRSLNIDKDSPKNRVLLGAFWDKLSLDDAKEILSLKNDAIEVLDFFNSRMDMHQMDGEWSVNEVLQVIIINCRSWSGEGMKMFSQLRFTYEQENHLEEFFIPYVWRLVLSHSFRRNREMIVISSSSEVTTCGGGGGCGNMVKSGGGGGR